MSVGDVEGVLDGRSKHDRDLEEEEREVTHRSTATDRTKEGIEGERSTAESMLSNSTSSQLLY
jgi:hypothetical protein